MMKPTESKLITGSFKGAKESKLSSAKKNYSPGKYAYSNSGADEVVSRSGIYNTRFKRKDLRQFNPRHYATGQISEQDVKDLKQIFDYYDSTKTGVLLPTDLKLFLSENGFNPTKHTVYEIIAEYDQEQTGGISFGEFMKAMSSRPKDKTNQRELHHVFKKYDRKGKGYITLQDLKEMSKLLNEEDDEQMLKMMIKRAGTGVKDRLTFQEFYELMTKTVY